MNRPALVTGATRGIGRAIALRLARDGYDVIAGYRASEAHSVTLTAEIEALGRRCLAARFDVSDGDAVRRALDPIVEEVGAPHVVVNNAGITRDVLFGMMDESAWTSVIDTDLGGFFNVTSTVVRGMIARRAGRIINIGSVSARRGQLGQVAYAAAKAGLEGATRTLARELGRYGITVNTVAPGVIDTEMLPEGMGERMRKEIPLRRLGTTDDVAAVVAFLAGESAAYVTGQVIAVDGGLT